MPAAAWFALSIPRSPTCPVESLTRWSICSRTNDGGCGQAEDDLPTPVRRFCRLISTGFVPRTQLIDFAPSGRVGALLEVSRKDVMVVFDMRRYQKDTIALAEGVRDRGATIVLITDPWLSPIADFANHVLPVDVDATSPRDSVVSCIALIEVLVAGIMNRLGEPARRRVSEFERLREGDTWDDDETSN